MSKTFHIDVAFSTKLVISNEELAGVRDYIKSRNLPEPFHNYLSSLDDDEALQAFLKYCTRMWFKGELEQGVRDGGVYTYSPVKVTVREKQH